jgi:hypothetical protein
LAVTILVDYIRTCAGDAGTRVCVSIQFAIAYRDIHGYVVDHESVKYVRGLLHRRFKPRGGALGLGVEFEIKFQRKSPYAQVSAFASDPPPVAASTARHDETKRTGRGFGASANSLTLRDFIDASIRRLTRLGEAGWRDSADGWCISRRPG